MRIRHPYIPTSKQAELHSDPTRFKVAVFGRRSGKSTFALNEAIQVCLEKPESKVWIVAPTFQQAKDIYWRGSDMINKYVLPQYIEKKNDSDLLLEFKTRSLLQFKGADRPEVMRGSALDLVIEDEIAEHRYARDTWEKILLPSLSDRQGKAIFIGTPKGYNFLWELYEFGQQPEQKLWKSWRIPTWDSGAPWTLTKKGREELERLKRDMSEEAYMQEYGADFRKYTGLVFKGFDRSVHVKEFEVNDRYKIEIGQDFGYTNPTAVLFSYFDDDDNWWIFDEYYEVEKPIIEHAGILLSKRNEYRNKDMVIFGDSEDPQNIVEYAKYRWFITKVSKSRNSVKVGIDRIEERFNINPITKKPRIFIHPRCKNLVYELERYRWREKKEELNDPEVPEDAYDHLIDAARYIINSHVKASSEKIDYKELTKLTYQPLGGYR